jgi:hypothetical protein
VNDDWASISLPVGGCRNLIYTFSTGSSLPVLRLLRIDSNCTSFLNANHH